MNSVTVTATYPALAAVLAGILYWVLLPRHPRGAELARLVFAMAALVFLAAVSGVGVKWGLP